MPSLSLNTALQEEQEVTLIVMKRPPVTSREVSCQPGLWSQAQVVTEEEVTVAEETTDTACLKEETGYVKEFVEVEGLATILSKQLGLVLFHVGQVWVAGGRVAAPRVRAELAAATEVTFLYRVFRGEEFRALSEERALTQAVAVWSGARPAHILRQVAEEEHRHQLHLQRKSFMLYVKGDVFLRAALVRVKGEVAGWLTEHTGIVETRDSQGSKANVLFHTDEVRVFRRGLREFNRPARQVLPVGCLVTVDARRVHVSGVRNVGYQAVAVLAGTWPTTPHPTLLPGGHGSHAPLYELPAGTNTFYYLELALENKLQRKVGQLKELVASTRGEITYSWNKVRILESKEDYLDWRQSMGGRSSEGWREGRKEVVDAFRADGAAEEELRPRTKAVTRRLEERTWYTPEAWQHGGLRLKEEKQEPVEQEGESSAGGSRRPGKLIFLLF